MDNPITNKGATPTDPTELVDAQHGGDLSQELKQGWAPLPNTVVLSLVLAGLRVRLSRSIVTMVTVVLAIAFLTYTGLNGKLSRNLSRLAVALTEVQSPSRAEINSALAELAGLNLSEGITEEPLRWLPVWLPRASDDLEKLYEARKETPSVTVEELEVLQQELELRTWIESPKRREMAAQHTDSAKDFFEKQAARLLPTFRNSSSWNSIQYDQAKFLLEVIENHPQSPASREVLAAVFSKENDARSGATLVTLLRKAGINPDTAISGASAETWIIVMALLLCTVGIANAMLMSVTERFREIGTMKCLGAPDGLVVKIFLLESAFLGVSGAFFGIILGAIVVLGSALAQFGGFGLQAFPLLQGIDVMGYSLIAGILLAIAGTAYPAILAARMNPVDALRIEE